MDTRDKSVFIFGIFLEVVGMGLGIIDSVPDQVGWIIIAVSIPFLVYALIKLLRYKPLYTVWQEVRERGKVRGKYLNPLKQYLLEKIEEYDGFAKAAISIPLSEYDNKYFKTDFDRESDNYNKLILSKMIGRWSIITIPLKISFVVNNTYYRELKRGEKLSDRDSLYDELLSHIVDSKLLKYLKRFWRCEHDAASLKIFYEIARVNFDSTVRRLNHIYKQQEIAQDEYQNALSDVNTRIDQLLGGVPDER